ncbi:NAD-dependent epimerase/dehydratase family protein [Tumebacillus flagellatus]|uniref:NAD-dependent epimerase/dehydratase domain-containing protein n=1 Tax=Tumebacillus flagellatus TaxID=1157490 RepID=A0A074LR93_9BACL|nr:NAD-dependent epimerase/dehydratase family protein [Tumebacillus flagellatus]KEO84621.1 hypothetical protein EL26_03640 [Tumebacillus flagellatus]
MKTALIFGGTRFFGKHLVEKLLADGVTVTVATRGQTEDGFGDRVERLTLDRLNRDSLSSALEGKSYDVVFDQICYGPDDAQNAVDVLTGKVGRYVFTSTMAVYDPNGETHAESDFDPYRHEIQYGPYTNFSYADGKRHAEGVFFQKADFPVVAIRIPIVVGLDDYTRRLHFHVEHVQEEKPFWMPNLDASMGYITSEEAGKFIAWCGTVEQPGPYNGAADGTISLRDLLSLIEETVGKQALVAEGAEASPYGVPASWLLNTDKAKFAGYEFTNLNDWLPQLVREIADGK